MSEHSLRKIRVFSDLEEGMLNDLDAHCNFVEFDESDIIFDKGDQSTNLYCVLEGRVRILAVAGEDHDVALAEIDSGELFGEFAAFDKRSRSGQAVAVGTSVLGIIEGDQFIELCRKYPDISFAIIRMLIDRIRTSNERFTELSLLPDKVRICREILRLSRPHESDPHYFVLHPAPSHRELASWTGSNQQIVNDTLGWLLKSKIIERPRGEMRTFLIKDFLKLRSLCEFNRYI